MSQAFVKESDEEWLHDVSPTLPALINYLTRQNNGIRVYELRQSVENGLELFHMSNGMSYTKSEKGCWELAD